LKFKYLIIAFCIIIIIVVLLAVFLPPLILGSSFTFNINFITIPVFIFIFLLLAGLTIFLLLNYRFLSLLEREDWPALAYYLEQKVFVKSLYTNRNVKILAGSYLIISDYQSVLKLENKAQIARPSVISKNPLIFGSARILCGSYNDAAAFFRTHFEKCGKNLRQWVRWFYGFTSLLSGDFAQAESEFTSLAVSSSNALISGLSAYFLTTCLEKKSANPEKCRNISESGKNRVIKSVKNPAGWKKETEKLGTDIHVAIIKRYLDETSKWLYDSK